MTRQTTTRVGLLAAAFLLTATSRGLGLDAPQLRPLLKGARVIVSGEVERVTPYADDRVAVAELRITKVLKGHVRTGGDRVSIIEMRELPTPPVFAAGDRGLVFLEPAPRSTFLVKALPQGIYLQPTSRELGFLKAESPAELMQTEAIVDRFLAASRTPESDPAARAVSSRHIVFDLVSASNPILVRDGAASLASIPDLAATLTDAEKRQLETALRRTDLPVRIRVALIDSVGANHLAQVAPVLRALDSPPAVLDASWKALEAFGAPPPREQIEARLAADDPDVRAAAVRELLRRDGADAVKQVSPLVLHDPERSVRLAAIKALGELKRPEALPPLERVFAYEEGELQQAAGRAIVSIGGDAGADALGRLAFEAPPGAQRYALMILLTTVGQNDPRVQRVATSHPNELMRAAVTQPFEYHTHTHAGGHEPGVAAE